MTDVTTESTERDEAIGIVLRLQEIAHNDMLVRGQYVTEVVNRDLRDQGAVCGGRRACMVGSFMLAAGLEYGRIYEVLGSRTTAASLVPGMTLARAALNEASTEHDVFRRWMTARGYDGTFYAEPSETEDPMEYLFEDASLWAELDLDDLPDLVLEVTNSSLEILRHR